MSKDNLLGGFNFDTSPFTQALQSSMELMNQTWQNLGTSKTMPFATPPMNLEDLDKRIEELKHVENWLNMNLAMLKNTIQGLELQRHSIASFKDLMQTVSDQHKDTPSLDEVLSSFSKTAASAAEKESHTTPSKTTAQKVPSASAEPPPADAQEASNATLDEAIGNATAGAQAATEALQQAGQAWWSLMQNQLENLLSAQAEQQNQVEQVSAASGTEAKAKAEQITPTRLKRASKPAAKRVSPQAMSSSTNALNAASAASAAKAASEPQKASTNPNVNPTTSTTRTSKASVSSAPKTAAKKVPARKKPASTSASTTPKTSAATKTSAAAKPRASANKVAKTASKSPAVALKKAKE